MNTRILGPAAAMIVLAGCTDGSGGGAAPTGGTVGFSAGLGSVSSMASSANSQAVSTAATFVLARYQATERQEQVALQNAKRALAVIKSQPKKKAAMKRNKIRYIAVDTERDKRAKGAASVMLFDTQSEQIVGADVYDIEEAPQLGASALFETYAATYVGTGT